MMLRVRMARLRDGEVVAANGCVVLDETKIESIADNGDGLSSRIFTKKREYLVWATSRDISDTLSLEVLEEDPAYVC